jgi:hypothetical protein
MRSALLILTEDVIGIKKSSNSKKEGNELYPLRRNKMQHEINTYKI